MHSAMLLNRMRFSRTAMVTLKCSHAIWPNAEAFTRWVSYLSTLRLYRGSLTLEVYATFF